MDPLLLRQQLKNAFSSQATDHGRLWQMMHTIQEYRVTSLKAANHKLVWLGITWLAAYAIGAGFVSEGTIGNLRIQQVQALLILCPPIIGMMMYLYDVALGAAYMYSCVLKEGYEAILPALNANDIDGLMHPPLPGLTEAWLLRYGAFPEGAWFYRGWMFCLSYLPKVGGLAALVHVSVLLASSAVWPWYASCISIIIGAVTYMAALNIGAGSRQVAVAFTVQWVADGRKDEKPGSVKTDESEQSGRTAGS